MLTEEIKLRLLRTELRTIIANIYNIPHYLRIDFKDD